MNAITSMFPRACIASLALLTAGVGCKQNAETTATQSTAKAAKAEVPGALVLAASAHLRTVDVKNGRVIGGLEMRKAVRAIRFAPDGSVAYVAASDGVRAVEPQTGALIAKLTENPARNIELDPTGAKLFVLEHSVRVHESGGREIMPFALVTVDTKTNKVVEKTVIGQRIMYARPAIGDAQHLVISEAGQIRVGDRGVPLHEGRTIDFMEGFDASQPARVRKTVAVHQDTVYIPVEGVPSRILVIDLKSGASSNIQLEERMLLRGLAVSANGETLVVNAGNQALVVDLRTRAIRASLELTGAHADASISSDGKWAFLAQTIDQDGGAVAVLGLEPLRYHAKIHLDDISPWALAVRP